MNTPFTKSDRIISLDFNDSPNGTENWKVLLKYIELSTIWDTNKTYPVRYNKRVVTIDPSLKNHLNYFSFHGINNYLGELELNPDKKYLVKPIIVFPHRKSLIPDINIRILEFDTLDGEFTAEDQYDILSEFRTDSKGVKYFTNKREKKLIKAGISVDQLKMMVNHQLSPIVWINGRPIGESIESVGRYYEKLR